MPVVLSLAEATRVLRTSNQGPLEGTLSSPRTGLRGSAPAQMPTSTGGEGRERSRADAQAGLSSDVDSKTQRGAQRHRDGKR